MGGVIFALVFRAGFAKGYANAAEKRTSAFYCLMGCGWLDEAIGILLGAFAYVSRAAFVISRSLNHAERERWGKSASLTGKWCCVSRAFGNFDK
ncbi:hypothetical protein D3C87_1958930 [compost metagenome]